MEGTRYALDNIDKLNNPNGIEQGGDNSFFWMGKGDAPCSRCWPARPGS